MASDDKDSSTVSRGKSDADEKSVREGLAEIKTSGKVFYNPVQEFNRDLSVAVISTFVEKYAQEKLKGEGSTDKVFTQAGIKYDNGATALEALSATGLRSIRYAKEIPGIKQIVANDISQKAVENITRNVKLNCVENVITVSHDDATMLMYKQKRAFDVIDLDPYGCPSIFLDSAVQSVSEGGLLLVTATDMAVLAGNTPETCYVKYGAVSLKIKSCHEMALRILLQCIEAHANRYGRYIEPLLSLSADFYIRVFIRIFSGPAKCKRTTSKLSMVYHCPGCDSFTLQPLGIIKQGSKQPKFCLPAGPPVGSKCEHCHHNHHIGGPIWSAPIHSQPFVEDVLRSASTELKTWQRIQGILSMIIEELTDSPLYYTADRLSSTIHIQVPPMLKIRSAILNAGFNVSYSHANKASIKTDAPARVVWDIMRAWEREHPVKQERLNDNSPGAAILSQKATTDVSFAAHPFANPESRRQRYIRFQENPEPNWGPGTRATVMIGDQKMNKRELNQGRKKRKHSPESAA